MLKQDILVRTNLTTNGCYTKRKAELVMKTCHSTTVSYHAEATEQEKELVKNNHNLCMMLTITLV